MRKFTQEEIQEFQALYTENFGIHLSEEVAREQASSLVGLIERIYFPKKEMEHKDGKTK